MSVISQTLCWILYLHSFPGGSDGIESACNVGDLGLIPGLGRSPWRRKWQLTPVFLPGKSHGQSSLVGYSPWGRREWDMTEWQTLKLSLSLHIALMSARGSPSGDGGTYRGMRKLLTFFWFCPSTFCWISLSLFISQYKIGRLLIILPC